MQIWSPRFDLSKKQIAPAVYYEHGTEISEHKMLQGKQYPYYVHIIWKNLLVDLKYYGFKNTWKWISDCLYEWYDFIALRTDELW